MCMSCRVVSDDRPRRTTACVRYYGEPIERAFFFCPPMRGSVLGRLEYRLHGCIVCECMESLCVYIVVHAHRANAFVRVPGHGTMGMDGWMACVHSCRLSSTREETDGFERRTERDHRHRSHRTRLSRVSLALSLERRIHSFIHSYSFIPLRTNERTKGRTNDRTRSRGTRERRTRSTRSFASNSARARRGTRVCLERTTHRTHRIARAF